MFAAAPSVELFAARARALSPDFELDEETSPPVARICRRLDGIPLAIELAATRVKSLPIEEIDRRLDDRFRLLTGGRRSGLPHHQTLRALVDWSFDQLAPADRAVLRRLSVFVGGWSLETAEMVCALDGIESWDILDALARLVEKSMVEIDYERGRRTRQARYRMLETVREYARLKLIEAGEERAAGARLRGAAVHLAETAEKHLVGSDQLVWFARLDADNENLRVAMDEATQTDVPLGLRLAGALGRYWDLRGRWSEGRERVAGLLAHPDSASRTSARAKALAWAGILAGNQGDSLEAAGFLAESLAIRREIGDLSGVANSLHALGNLAYTSSEYAKARVLHEESLGISRALDDRLWIARSLNNLGNISLALGDHPQARAYYEESLAIKRGQGDPQGVAASLSNLGHLAEEQRSFDEARRQYEESLSILRNLGDRPGIARSLYNLGHVAMKQGDDARARACLEESLRIRREMKDRGGTALCLNNLGVAALHRRDHDSAQSHFSEAMALWEDLGNRQGVATCWNNLGNAIQCQGELAEAEACYARSLAIRREMNDRQGEALCLNNLGGVAGRAGRSSEARSFFRESLKLRREMEDLAGIASCLESLGELVAETEDLPTAARLIAAAQALRERLDLPLPQIDRGDQEQAIGLLRARLGPESFAREWETGRSMSFEEAITIAIRET
jgi:tetratricopeptide (TPR) repeat protein